MSVNDTLFWGILGSLMVANVWIENRYKKRAPQTGWSARLKNTAQIAATFAFIALLWSMWNADSVTEWFDFLRSGNI
jgi:hypothetical protein